MSKFFRFAKDFKEVVSNKDKRNVLMLRMSKYSYFIFLLVLFFTEQQPQVTFKKALLYGGLFYGGLSLYYCYNHNERMAIQMSVSRLASKFAGVCSQIYVPVPCRNFVFGQFANTYNVIQEDMLCELKDFNNFREFFTRQVKPRNISDNQNQLVSPADSKVLQIGEITGDKNILVKNIKYSLGEFLTGIEGYQMEGDILDSLKKSKDKSKSKIYQAIFYLNPGDYHRYHSPIQMLIKRAWHIVGYLAPVKESYIGSTSGVYESNERVALVGEYNQGFISNVYVGATNVGSMTLNFDPSLETNTSLQSDFQKSNVREYSKKDNEKTGNNVEKLNFKQEEAGVVVGKGQECGMFKLGSTVVVLFEVQDDVKFMVEPGQFIRYGQPFAEITPKKK